MKFALLFLFLSLNAFADRNVSVTIDGETYSCSKGGSSDDGSRSRNLCDCIAQSATGAGREYWWKAYKKGVEVATGGDQTFGSYATPDQAVKACQAAVVTQPKCY